MWMQERVWSSVVLICLASPWCGNRSATTNQNHINDGTTAEPTRSKISLEFISMTDPVSVFVTLTPDNKAKMVSYSRSLLVVKSVLEGYLPPKISSRVFAKTSDPEFAKALRIRSFGTDGLKRGDQFHLRVATARAEEECFGFVQDSPAIIRSLVEDLLSVGAKLEPTALADAYLKSEPIPKTRYASLQRSPKLRFVTTREFPADIQNILSTAVNSPRDFFALTRAQYLMLLARVSHGHELFLSDQSSGHQFTLFQAPN